MASFNRDSVAPAAELMLEWSRGDVEVDFRDYGSSGKWMEIESCCSWNWDKYEYRKRPREPQQVSVWLVMWSNGPVQYRSIHETADLAEAQARERRARGDKAYVIEMTGEYHP